METLPATHKKGKVGDVPDRTFKDQELGKHGPFSVTVTSDDVARWGRIFDDNNPWYTGDSPLGGPVAPPSILYYPSQMFLGRYLIGKSPTATRQGGFARYHLETFAPIPVDKELVVTGEIDDIFVRRGRGYVHYVLEARDGDTLVQRHWKLWSFGLSDEEAAQFPDRPSEPRETDDGEGTEKIGPLAYDLTLERMADLEGPGEHNAHTDIEAAKKMGRPGALAQGALSFGLLSRLLTDTYGERYLVGGMLDVRFLQPQYSGTAVTAHGQVVKSEGGKDYLKVWVENADGQVVTAGNAYVRSA